MQDERNPHKVKLRQCQTDAVRSIALATHGTLQSVVASLVPGNRGRADALIAAHNLSPRCPDGGRQPVGETAWSLIAAGLRDTMRQAGVSITQLDLLGTDELIERTWPAFLEASNREAGLLPPARDTGCTMIPGEQFGFDGRVVLRGDEVMTRHGPMPRLPLAHSDSGGAA